jgi:hypothetical protein
VSRHEKEKIANNRVIFLNTQFRKKLNSLNFKQYATQHMLKAETVLKEPITEGD